MTQEKQNQTAKASTLTPGEKAGLFLASMFFLIALFATFFIPANPSIYNATWVCQESDLASYTLPLIAAVLVAGGVYLKKKNEEIEGVLYTLSLLALILASVSFVRFKATGDHVGYWTAGVAAFEAWGLAASAWLIHSKRTYARGAVVLAAILTIAVLALGACGSLDKIPACARVEKEALKKELVPELETDLRKKWLPELKAELVKEHKTEPEKQ